MSTTTTISLPNVSPAHIWYPNLVLRSRCRNRCYAIQGAKLTIKLYRFYFILSRYWGNIIIFTSDITTHFQIGFPRIPSEHMLSRRWWLPLIRQIQQQSKQKAAFWCELHSLYFCGLLKPYVAETTIFWANSANVLVTSVARISATMALTLQDQRFLVIPSMWHDSRTRNISLLRNDRNCTLICIIPISNWLQHGLIILGVIDVYRIVVNIERFKHLRAKLVTGNIEPFLNFLFFQNRTGITEMLTSQS